jgi:hypothetical protein
VDLSLRAAAELRAGIEVGLFETDEEEEERETEREKKRKDFFKKPFPSGMNPSPFENQ